MHTPNWFDKLFYDKHGRLILWQRPNLPIIGFVVCWLGAFLIDTPTWLHHGLLYLSYAWLFAWGYLEVTSGVTLFRRVVGVAALLYTVFLLLR